MRQDFRMFGLAVNRQSLVVIGITVGLTTVLTALSFWFGSFEAHPVRQGPSGLSWPLLIHLVTVLPAVPLGAWLLLRKRKGDRLHRLLGRLWAGLMLTTAIATIWLTGPSGRFSFIHVFTLMILISVPRAVLAIRRGDVRTHRAAVTGAYIGLVVAGAFTFLPGRLIPTWLFG
jgi:uncharacterized membrane protein